MPAESVEEFGKRLLPPPRRATFPVYVVTDANQLELAVEDSLEHRTTVPEAVLQYAHDHPLSGVNVRQDYRGDIGVEINDAPGNIVDASGAVILVLVNEGRQKTAQAFVVIRFRQGSAGIAVPTEPIGQVLKLCDGDLTLR
jgi:hypothetical protein